MNNENDKIYNEGVDLETYEKIYKGSTEVLAEARIWGAEIIRRVKKTAIKDQPFEIRCLHESNMMWHKKYRPGIISFDTFEIDINDPEHPKTIYLEQIIEEIDIVDCLIEEGYFINEEGRLEKNE